MPGANGADGKLFDVRAVLGIAKEGRVPATLTANFFLQIFFGIFSEGSVFCFGIFSVVTILFRHSCEDVRTRAHSHAWLPRVSNGTRRAKMGSSEVKRIPLKG